MVTFDPISAAQGAKSTEGSSHQPWSTCTSNATTPGASQAPSILSGFDSEKDAIQPAQPDIESSKPTETSSTPVRTITGFKWILMSISLWLSAFLYGLDTTIAADVQGPVVEAFGNVELLSWIGSGFPLGSVAVIVLVGRLFGTFNLKWVFIGSIVLFEVGSVVCGAAPSMNALIVGRVIAGAGGAGIYLGSLNYFTLLALPTERGLFISLVGFFWGIGAVLGPVIGGGFAESNATWRWAFYINLVIGAVLAPIWLFILPSGRYTAKEKDGQTVIQRVSHFDWVGMALMAALWVLFTVAFSMSGGVWKWNSAGSITTIVLTIVLIIVTALQQYFTVFTSVENRAFPGHLLKSLTQILLVICSAAGSTCLFVTVYFIPVYFQFVQNDSPVQAAIRLLPFIIILVVVNTATGHLLSKLKFYMPFYLIAGILITIHGALLTVYLGTGTSLATIYGITVIGAVGNGLIVQIGYSVATLTAAPEDMSNAITLQNLAQIGGNLLALVIAGQVYQSSAAGNLREVLAGHGLSDVEIVEAVAGARSVVFASLTEELKRAAIEGIVDAMRNTFVLVIVAGAVMTLSGIVMKRERLFGEITTA